MDSAHDAGTQQTPPPPGGGGVHQIRKIDNFSKVGVAQGGAREACLPSGPTPHRREGAAVWCFSSRRTNIRAEAIVMTAMHIAIPAWPEQLAAHFSTICEMPETAGVECSLNDPAGDM